VKRRRMSTQMVMRMMKPEIGWKCDEQWTVPLSSIVALVLVFPALGQEVVVQQSEVQKHPEILMDDWAQL
jgi:hypothetical protein